MKFLKSFIAILALAPILALAEGGEFPLDTQPKGTTDLSSLQNGAKLFVNYCLNCHAAASMRYNRLRDIGLNEDQIKNNLLFTGTKVGDLMKISMQPQDAKAWFGVVPPDLSVIARAKASHAGTGGDYLYTYLRSFYKDDTRPTGWNNMVFPNVGMPHALWDLQGIRTVKMVKEADPHDESKTIETFGGYTQVKPGKLSALEYDNAVADLVSYLEWMAEPAQNTRRQLGVWVLLFLGLFALLTWRLNASYWKEIK
ncbi:MAG: cytochrome [Herbaspirillum sp.]|jgi:ubiquinol-cytochrome c reductase cytochrome c1 subunit|nr:cytochrome [Herbaspirillum sp.]